MTAVQPATTGYRISDYFDEAFLADGELRGPYRRLFDGVDGASLNEVQGQVQCLESALLALQCVQLRCQVRG